MNNTAIPISRPPLPSLSRLTARLPDFVALSKPRVMGLAVFTALVGLTLAPVHLDSLLRCVAILGIAVGAGGAGVLNMWWDADIDRMMRRTAMRPIPRGKVSRGEALAFGLVLSGAAVAILALAINPTAAALLAFTIFFYVVVYTAWLKRSTPQNIVIGGVAGALPPVIGWAAATGGIAVEPFILFLIIFIWTPPHVWALSLNRVEEYSNVGIPMLPVVAGRAATKRQILVYSVLLIPISMLPWVVAFAGVIYAATAAISGALLVGLAVQLGRSNSNDRRAAHRLFVFSISYLFVLFLVLLADHRSNPPSPTMHARVAALGAGVGQVELGADRIQNPRGSFTVSANEA
jgi:heme o synthase